MDLLKQAVYPPWTEEQWEKWIYSFALEVDREKEKPAQPAEIVRLAGGEDQ